MCEFGGPEDYPQTETISFLENGDRRLEHLNDNVGDPCGSDYPGQSDDDDDLDAKKNIENENKLVQQNKPTGVLNKNGGTL